MQLKKKVILESLESAGNLYTKEMNPGAALVLLYNILELNHVAVEIQAEIREAALGRDKDGWAEAVRGIEAEMAEVRVSGIAAEEMGQCKVSPKELHKVMFLFV